MKGNHFHISVRDLETTLSWFERVWQLIPTHKGKTFAVLPFGSMQLVIDASNQDSLATLGFDSENCDRDCQAVVERGATVIEQPADRSWGVRVAYVKGPAGLTLEIEQPLGKLQVPEKGLSPIIVRRTVPTQRNFAPIRLKATAGSTGQTWQLRLPASPSHLWRLTGFSP